MKKAKILISMAVGLMLHTTASAEEFEYEGIRYNTLTDSTAEVARNDNLEGDIVIPKYVTFGEKQLKVTAIGRYAFSNWNYYATPIKSVTFPDDITSIGENAFSGQTAITEISIPETVEFIGYNALARTGIKSIVMTHMPKEMQWGVFYDCAQLEKAVMPDAMEELPGQTFQGCKSLKEVQLPQTLRKISMNAFGGCEAMESFTLPDSVRVLEGDAFWMCTGLKEFHWNKVIETLDGYLFNGCTNLTEIELPPSIKVIPYCCFFNCYGLRRIVIPNTVTEIRYQAFENCTSLEEVVWDGVNIKSLESYVFRYCKSLKQLTIPDSVSVIYNNAFEGAGLTSIVLGPKLEQLYEYAFADCNKLTDIYLRTSKLNELSPWGQIFSAPTFYFGTLHVPEGQKNQYMHREVWKKFANITEENTSGKSYCMVNVSCQNHQFKVNDGEMTTETHLEIEKGEPLTLSIPKEDIWYSTNNHRYLSAILVNGEDRLTDFIDGQLSFEAVEEDLDIEVKFDTYGTSLAIYQDGRGGLEFLTELRGKTSVIVLPADGYKAEAKWGPWHKTYQWDPWYETEEVIGKKTYNMDGEWYYDQEINITYQKK